METVWYLLLAAFLATYFVLGGYDYGTGLHLARAGGAQQRRAVLNAVGPFFLGNEVWLVAAVGILFGAFPVLEGALLTGLYPLVVTALVGVITVTAAFQLRGRAQQPGARTAWDVLLMAGSVLAAGGWGAVLGGWLQGAPLAADGHATGIGPVATPFVASCAVAFLALAAVHGAAFLALRLPAPDPARFARTGAGLVAPALIAVGAATVAGLLSARVRTSVNLAIVPLVLLAALVGVLLLARFALRRGWRRRAFAATSVAMVLPLALVLGALYPDALASTVDGQGGLAVTDAAAAPGTLRLLGWLAFPLIPALVGFQAMCWWAFRVRADRPSPVFY